ncbi:MAG TPA: hypothetical protein VME23_02520 [Terracidiphilus sp.]|nr:hypothetical protein [Terracidiphilus sp.]
MLKTRSDLLSCAPDTPSFSDFNAQAAIPFGVTIEHIYRAMLDFTDFLRTVDTELVRKDMTRLEDMLMPANFSSMVGEFITSVLPRHCPAIAKNSYHNGHPDLLPSGKYPGDAAQHAGADGIEVKASRYLKGWQGHNAEDVWLMVFVFQSGRPADKRAAKAETPFRFLAVYGGMLAKSDWQFAGRSATSRRTITATVLPSGFEKMARNWIYRAPRLEIKS